MRETAILVVISTAQNADIRVQAMPPCGCGRAAARPDVRFTPNSGHRAASFDHFVGDGKNARGHGEAKRFCSL
jgi:hypothetical protein